MLNAKEGQTRRTSLQILDIQNDRNRQIIDTLTDLQIDSNEGTVIMTPALFCLRQKYPKLEQYSRNVEV